MTKTPISSRPRSSQTALISVQRRGMNPADFSTRSAINPSLPVGVRSATGSDSGTRCLFRSPNRTDRHLAFLHQRRVVTGVSRHSGQNSLEFVQRLADLQDRKSVV